jgi:hypothetical protein
MNSKVSLQYGTLPEDGLVRPKYVRVLTACNPHQEIN